VAGTEPTWKNKFPGLLAPPPGLSGWVFIAPGVPKPQLQPCQN
jgi:hypothetical protein